MSFADRAGLSVEITQSLRCGRAYLTETSTLPVLSDCVLVLVHPEHGGELRLPAQIVMANEHGTGLSLTTLSAQHLVELDGFADSPAPLVTELTEVTEDATSGIIAGAPAVGAMRASSAAAPAHASSPPPAAVDNVPPLAAVDSTHDAEPDEAAMSDAALQDLPLAAADVDAQQDADSEAALPDDSAMLGEAADDFARSDEEELEYAEPGQASSGTELQSENRQERLRNLSPNEQLKIARRGELADRLAVERMYGKQVWEALLQNPRLTIPEVAKIARKGTVPKPLLDVILDNNGWIKADAVRRALLSNPKIGADSVTRLLRITPKHELKLIEKGTTYGAVVREAARRMLKQPG